MKWAVETFNHLCRNNQYTECPILIDRSKYPLKYAIRKKMVSTKIVKDSRGHLSVLMTLTFRSIFKVIWRSRPFFKMETSIFETGFEKNRKFYIRNYIFKFIIVTLKNYNKGQIVKKCSEAVYLNFGGIWEW